MKAGWFLLFPFLLAALDGQRSFIPFGDVRVEVRVDETTQPGSTDEPITREMIVKVEREPGFPAVVALSLALPEVLGGRVHRIEMDLKAKKAGEHRMPVTFRGGPPEEAAIPVSVAVNGEPYMTMNVLLAKTVSWKVIGPFPGNTSEGLEKEFPPEKRIDTQASYDGIGEKRVSWQPFPAHAIGPDGFFDLNIAVGPVENATAYASASVSVPRESKARLLLGSDDGVKVWHNGKLIHTHKVHRGSEPGQDKIDLDLQEGKNSFLLKVCNDDGGWGFHFEIDDGAGKPVPELQWHVGLARKFITDSIFRLKEVSRTAAALTWKSDVPVRSAITVVKAKHGRKLVWNGTPKDEMNTPLPGAKPMLFHEESLTMDHSFRIAGLKPGTRYLVWAEPAIRGARTEKMAFYTAPPPGKAQYLRLTIATVIFTNTTPPQDADREGAKVPVPAEEVERLKREMAQTRLFYWINSGMSVVLDPEFFVTDKFHPATHDGYGVGYGVGDEEAFKEIVEAAGRKLSEFDGRIFISMEKRFDEKNGRWFYPHSGGGTLGPEHFPGYGKSAWKGGSNNAWLFCHEFQHQFDALYNYSLGPEHLFCHFQPWDDTAHRHGEHWDGNAWIFLEWAGFVTREHQGWPYLDPRLWFRYFMNRWGEVIQTADADSDGIPDDDPAVPLDERRFGSLPDRIDSDNDGLSDLMEAMASEWLEYGLGEIWAGSPEVHRCNPKDPDTDKDGFKDGEDPYPLYAIDPLIPKGKPGHSFASLRDEAFRADFSLTWDDEFLTIGMTSKEVPERVKIFLDCNDDGWFMGADNFDLRVKPESGLEPQFHNCGVPGKWPFYDPSRVDKDAFKCTQKFGNNGDSEQKSYSLLIQVPRNPRNGLLLEEGERIGILLAVGPKGGAGRPGQWGDLTLFEPHRFFTFQLVQ